jgi:polysaccharide biosynthesis transport protein
MSDTFRPSPLVSGNGESEARSVRISPAHTPVHRTRGDASRNEKPPTALSLSYVLTVACRWWKVVVPSGVVLAAIAAATVYLTFRPVYRGEAWLRICDSTPYVAFQSYENSSRFLDAQMAMMRSPIVIGPVVSRPEIAQLPEIKREETPVVWLGTKIKAASGGGEYVTISYDSPSPASAAMVVNAIVDTYLDLQRQDHAEQVQRVIELLEEEKDRRVHEVTTMRDSVRELAKQVTGKDPFSKRFHKDTEEASPLADLQATLIKAEVERHIIEARVKAFEESMAKGELRSDAVKLDRAVEEDPNVRKLREELLAKKAKLQEWDRKFKKADEDRDYAALKKEIDEGEAAVQNMRKSVREDLRKDFDERQTTENKEELAKMRRSLDSARVVENLLREREKTLLKNVREATGDTLQMEFKQAELDRSEQVLTLIAERAIKLRTEQRAPPRVVAAKRADDQIQPVQKVPIQQMALAGAMGLCLPLVLVVGWDWLSRRVSDSEQIELHTRLPVLGEIARLPARRQSVPAPTSRRFAGRNFGLFEESIDGLRTCLVLSESLGDIQALAITSASNSEGKTSIAIQLAVSIARASGQRVLLIDGDMRSPDIHRLLQTRQSPGLAEILSHESSVQEGIVTDWSDSVHVLPAGRLAVSPHRLLGNGEWKELLDELRRTYRYIVIDTPPILPASESLVLAKAADACLVCAMRDVSRIDQLRRSSERLVAAGAHPVGVVLNGVPTHEYAYSYGSYYGHHAGRNGGK